jgi:hypothetical protein
LKASVRADKYLAAVALGLKKRIDSTPVFRRVGLIRVELTFEQSDSFMLAQRLEVTAIESDEA